MTEAEKGTPGIVRACTSAQFEHAGNTVRIIKGETTVEVGHSILKGREHMFEPLVVDFPVKHAKAS
jgi:hypothetical protein